MKKIIFLALVVFLVPVLGQAACIPADMVMDGDYDDWADCEVMAVETDSEASNIQYWVDASSEWSTTDPGYDTWTVDYSAMLDIKRFKMTNDESFVYFYMRALWPMMSVMAPDEEWFDSWQVLEYGNVEWAHPELDAYEFVPTSLPELDGYMVWSFDADIDGTYDYYFVAHLTMPETFSEEMSDVELKVYQDADANGLFDPEADTELAELDPNDGATSMDEGVNPGDHAFEVKQNIETFYDVTGIEYGDTVKVRMQTHLASGTFMTSAENTVDTGDYTKGKRYTFNIAAPYNLDKKYNRDYLNKKGLKRSKVKVTWDDEGTTDKTRIRVYKYNNKTKKYVFYRLIKGIDGEKKIIMNLPRDKKYRIKVRSVDRNGELMLSDWSAYKKFNTN